MSARFSKCLTALVLLFALAICSAQPCAQTIRVKIAALNDFHGNLQPPPEGQPVAGGGSLSAGGIVHLATRIQRLRSEHRNFAFVHAGDLVGASPLLSSHFDDEPTIEAMNLAGLDFNAIGNHEFDSGVAHLERQIAGGCPDGGCKSGLPFGGARFGFIAANVIVRATGKTLVPPYGIREFEGVKVAFVGATTRETAALHPRLAGTLEFRDEAASINALVPELRAQGIEAIVVVIHEGGFAAGTANDCGNFRGPIVDIVKRLDPAVDVVVSGHTHQAYVCRLEGRLVTSAGSYGRLLTEIDLELDAATREVVRGEAVNHVLLTEIAPDAGQSALLERYWQIGSATLDRTIGRIATTFSRRFSPAGENDIGRLVADAHLEAGMGGAQVAFVNTAGVRTSLEYRTEGRINFADVYAVWPFTNTLVTMTLTGAQIVRALEQQWREGGAVQMLQVSSGFAYEWNPQEPPGRRVVPGSVSIGGEPVKPDMTYRVVANGFLASGGDGFPVFKEGTERAAGPDARESLSRYIEKYSPLTPSKERRIRRAMP